MAGRTKKNKSLLPWLSRNNDGHEGRFIQVGNSLLLSKEFSELTAGARCLYLCMAMESGGNRELQFTHGSAKKYGLAKASYDRYVKELKEYEFISAVPDKDLRQYAPGRYRFEFGWKTKSAPQFEVGQRGNLPQSEEGKEEKAT